MEEGEDVSSRDTCSSVRISLLRKELRLEEEAAKERQFRGTHEIQTPNKDIAISISQKNLHQTYPKPLQG